MEEIFVDASAFVALLSQIDKDHERALAVFTALEDCGAPLITTNHVVDETCTWFLYHERNGHTKAVEFGKVVAAASVLTGLGTGHFRRSSAQDLTVVYATPQLESVAWEIFSRYDTAGFSFTDCVSFAVMRAIGIKRAFAFDSHFDVMGFERL